MSWAAKQDYCGLADGTAIKCKDSNENRSGSYLEKTGQHGDIVATKLYGTANATPANVYTIAKEKSLSVTLGSVQTVDGHQYMLKSVSISTGSATEPTMSATAVQVEDGATTGNCFKCPEFTLSPDDVAQILFDAFTVGGDGCTLTQCNAEISCDVGLSKVNDDPVASDPHTAHIQLAITILQTGDAAPTVTPTDGWELSAPLSCSDPDSDLPTWTCSVSRPLTKTMAA